MTQAINRKREEGFTIIEVLIVLAIAGLIMLVVFLAVPALQRNQRNSEARSEASRITTAINDFQVNGNGATIGSQANVDTIATAVGTRRQLTTMTWSAGAQGTTPANTAYIVRGTCNNNAAVPAATGRNYAVQFALEPAGTQGCLQI